MGKAGFIQPSSFMPANTAMPSAANNWNAKPAYWYNNLLFDGFFSFIFGISHFYYIGGLHGAGAVE